MCSLLKSSLPCYEITSGSYLLIFLSVGLFTYLVHRFINSKHTLIPNYFGPLLMLITASILFSIEAYARAGGGGGGGGGRNHCNSWYCIILYPIAFIYSAYIAYRINRKYTKVRQALNIMAMREPQWAEHKLLNIVEVQFIALQKAWGDQNLDVMKKALHPLLYPNWESQIKDYIKNNEKNVMANVAINDLRIVDVRNYSDDEKDEFTVCIDASATDQIISNGKIVSSKDTTFREFWTFENEKGLWLLKNVTQQNGWRRFVSARIIYEPRKK